ncbi:hypothetical protein K1719_028320 [Acacia pycnantha]|nr:hypothetical protein K1719_028320 [Acacia pycnantha]
MYLGYGKWVTALKFHLTILFGGSCIKDCCHTTKRSRIQVLGTTFLLAGSKAAFALCWVRSNHGSKSFTHQSLEVITTRKELIRSNCVNGSFIGLKKKAKGDGGKDKGKSVILDEGDSIEVEEELDWNARVCFIESLKAELS